MANKTLTARVKIDTKSAEASLKRLSRKINDVQRAVDKTSKHNKTLDSAIKKATTSTNKLNAATRKVLNTTNKVVTTTNKVNTANLKAVKSAQKIDGAYKGANKSANGILSTVKKIAGVYLGIQGISEMMSVSDKLTHAKNRFNSLNGNDTDLTAETMDKIYAAAQRSRTSYADMLGNVSKTMTLAGDSFQDNIDNAIRFQEIMAKAYTVGGAEPTEAATSMYQLVQALGSGILQGDELRSVREGAPLAYKAIEKFAQKVYETDESLKQLAADGKVTSDMVVAAIMDADFSGKLEEQFNETQATFEQTFDRIKNIATKAFEPVLEKINKLLNSEKGEKLIEGITNALVILGYTLYGVINVFATFFNWCAENWDWLQYVVVGAIIVIIGWLSVLAAQAVAKAAVMFWSWLKAYWPLVLIVATIMVILYVYELWRQGTISTTEAIVACLGVIAVALLVVALITQAWWLLWIVLALAVLAVVVMFFEEVCYWASYVAAWIVNILSGIWNGIVYILQCIISAITWVIATIINIIVGCLNLIIQLVWSFVTPFLGIIEFVLNATQGGFNGFLGGLANAFGQVLSWLVDVAKIATQLWDAIFGTNATDKLSSLQDSLLSWGKNDNAITINREAPTLDRISAVESEQKAWDLVGGLHTGYVNPNEWAEAGGAWGSGIESAVNNWGEQFKDEDYSLFSDIGNLLGINNILGNNQLPDSYDTQYDIAGAWDAPSVDDLLSNVGDIKDSMDLKDDDLEWLRKIAEMEWRNEFTTAEIKVDMTNNNSINGDRDLDGIVDHLADVLRSEMANVAYGVHY